MQKILTSQIREEICHSLECHALFVEDEKDATGEQEK